MRITLINNQLSPNRIAVYNALEAIDGVELTVLLMGGRASWRDWDIQTSDIKFRYTILPSVVVPVPKKSWALIINPTILFRLVSNRADVMVLEGLDQPTVWFALIYSKLRRIPVVSWFGSTSRFSKLRSKPFMAFRSTFLKLADSLVTYGSLSTEYAKQLGAKPEVIITGVNTVPIRSFRGDSETRPLQRNDETATSFLFVGRLTRDKGIDLLFESLASLSQDNWNLSIAGSGSDESNLRTQAKRLGIASHIKWLGYLQWPQLQHTLPNHHALVVPSRSEPWGLVVNEGLAAGLYVISSQEAGATHDLIIEGVNGRSFDIHDQDEFTRIIDDTMQRVMNGDFDNEYRNSISNSVAWATEQYSAERVYEAVLLAIGNKGNHSGERSHN